MPVIDLINHSVELALRVAEVGLLIAAFRRRRRG